MDLDQLRHFVLLADALHFGRASRACHLSPSALSRSIQRLEEEAGQALFERDRRTVRLTRAGQRFREYAIDALDRWESLRSGLATAPGSLSGEIRLYCSVTASYSILPALLARFRERHPEVSVHLETGPADQAIRRVVDGVSDVAIAIRPDLLAPGLSFRSLVETPLSFVGPVASGAVQTLVGKKRVAWECVPFILPEAGPARRRAEEWFRAQEVVPHIYAEVSGNEAILSMVSLGFGVGIVPDLVTKKSIFQNEVRILKVNPPLPPFDVGLCVRVRRLATPEVRAFWELGE